MKAPVCGGDFPLQAIGQSILITSDGRVEWELRVRESKIKAHKETVFFT